MTTPSTAALQKRLRFSDPQDARDEMNIAEFPIAVLGDRAPAGTKTLEFQDTIWNPHTNKHVTRKLVVQGTDRQGLPTAKDDEVLLGLIQLTRLKNNLTDRKVQFSRYELLRLLGWSDKGGNYHRLDEALHRWASVYLSYEKAWWDNRRKSWVDEGFHILERITLYEQEKSPRHHDQDLLPFSSFTWNEVLFRSFQDGYLKALNLDFFQSLESSVAKRMYRFLDKHFYHRSRLDYELRDFAFEHIGLSRDYHTGKIKEKLSAAIEELESKGFLEPLPPKERYLRISRGSWRVIFLKKPSRAESTAADASEKSLEKELSGRGVTAATAAELVAAFPAEHIIAKLAVFDWMTEEKDKRLSQNPAGYLVASIRDDYAAPQGFESKAERDRKRKLTDERQQSVKQQEQAERQKEQQRTAKKNHIKRILEELNPEARAELERQAIAAAAPDLADIILHNKLGADGVRYCVIEDEVLRRQPFPEPQEA